MDLNELYYRHQTSVARAASASTPEARLCHQGLASGYAARITALQSFAGAPAPLTVSILAEAWAPTSISPTGECHHCL